MCLVCSLSNTQKGALSKFIFFILCALVPPENYWALEWKDQ